MPNTLTFDFETTTSNSGNPYDKTNKAVCLAFKENDLTTITLYDSFASFPAFCSGQLAIGFNLKFDLHWLARCSLPLPTQVWDCQLAEFYLSGFTWRYPSLNEACEKRGLGSKIDVVKLEYWDKGIDTDQIPRDILTKYAAQDVDLTYQLYLKQLEDFKDKPLLLKSFRVACADLLVLQEMESNGLLFDNQLCQSKADEIQKQIQQIKDKLASVYPDVPINFGSGDQLSCFLYGGTIKETIHTQVGVFKSGERKGQPRYRVSVVEHTLPRLINPLPKSELQKPGYFATDVQTLQRLKGPIAKKYVADLLKLSALDKLLGTYYVGLPKINKEKNWPESKLHGTFNQCVAATSRLSSSSPNLQNMAGDCADVLISRYHD